VLVTTVTNRPLKKLDNRAAKFTIINIISLLSYKLDILPSIHNIFYADLLRLVVTNLLLSQRIDDP
jgi:hypothetical protein